MRKPNKRNPIKVMIVDDSALVHAVFKRMLADAPEIEVIANVHNGREALELIPKLNPDVICTDLHMPVMNGLELTYAVMSQYPRPILVISTSVREGDDDHHIFRLFEAGAVDIFPKPAGGMQFNDQTFRNALIHKIKILSGVIVFQKRAKPAPVILKPTIKVDFGPAPRKTGIVVMGASTGGPQALHTILKQLKSDFAIPIVCVQHISDGFTQGLVDWLDSQSKLQVRIGSRGERPQAGAVYFPPERIDLGFDPSGRFTVNACQHGATHCPSITVTFASAARCYGALTTAVLLTGMGKDGAEGLKTIKQAGGLTIAQDEATCVIFGMPQAAIELGAARRVAALNEIPRLLNRLNIK